MADTAAPDLPAQLVEDFHAASGNRHARAVHAKGVILEGTFQPSPEALALATATVFTAPRKMTVRFSDFTGLPDIPDASGDANPRGSAVKFAMGRHHPVRERQRQRLRCVDALSNFGTGGVVHTIPDIHTP
jgi:hypothetical protein